MRKTFTSSLYIVLLIAAFCSAFTAAQAGTVTTYSDGLGCLDGSFGDCPSNGFGPPPQPIVNFDVTGDFTGPGLVPPVLGTIATLDLYATVSNFFEQITCSQYCQYFWGGDFSQGSSLTIDAVLYYSDLSTRDIQFAGLINSGGFGTSYSEFCGYGPCGLEFIGFTFSGQWSNGWQSTGTAYITNELGQGGGGTLELNTQTPEPASLMLFGSGILGVAGVLRRRFGS